MNSVTQATATLLASAARNYAADGLDGLENGLDMFTHSVPDHYVRMPEAQHTAALVRLRSLVSSAVHYCQKLHSKHLGLNAVLQARGTIGSAEVQESVSRILGPPSSPCIRTSSKVVVTEGAG